MKIVCISDVHGKWGRLTIPECDLLISAGDYSFRGEMHMVRDFHTWLNTQPARHVVSVQGNHETFVDAALAKALAIECCPKVHFLEHEAIEIEGLKIFGSAWTPEFYNWAYNGARSLEAAQQMQLPYLGDKWKDIPMDTEILITHGPAYGMLDQCYYVDGVTPRERVGCHLLMEKIMQLDKLKFHVCGHIHSENGHKEFQGKKFYNASVCGETYQVDYEPTIIEI